MKSRKEVVDFIENVYPLIMALHELPFMRNGEYGVYMKVKFKPVFYVRQELMRDLMCLAPGEIKYSVDCETEIKDGITVAQHTPTLWGVKLYVTDKPDAPLIALALEPVDSVYARKE